MHRKPTQTFGHITFSKDGKVAKHLTRLSEDKPIQEMEALHKFLELFNTVFPERSITFLRQLEERDHDFIVDVAGQETEIQLTELVDRSFTFQMTQAEYDSGNWSHDVQKGYGELPWRIDPEKRDLALVELIVRKIEPEMIEDHIEFNLVAKWVGMDWGFFVNDVRYQLVKTKWWKVDHEEMIRVIKQILSTFKFIN